MTDEHDNTSLNIVQMVFILFHTIIRILIRNSNKLQRKLNVEYLKE